MESRYILLFLLTIPMMQTAAAAGCVELPGVKMTFQAARKVKAYDFMPVKCKLTGSGDVTVQVVASDNPAYEKYFDTAIPNRVAFRFDYLGNEGDNIKFRLTNVGDTIWKSGGYGKATPSRLGRPNVYLASNVAPGESITKTFPSDLLRKGNDVECVLDIDRNDSRHLKSGPSMVTLILTNGRPGDIKVGELDFGGVPIHDTFDELGQAFKRLKLSGGTTNITLGVQVPPWSKRLVVRLLKGGHIKAASVPVAVTRESLKLAGKPNTRWVMDGRPVFIAAEIQPEQMPEIRKRFGGANVVLCCGPERDPNSDWLKAARKNGFKITPIIGYIRLQIIARMVGGELMHGAPVDLQLDRVDALDPDFPKVMAQVVDQIYAAAGDLLFRTAEGKVPMCLSAEQSYGFPYASNFPTRWGGSSAADVAAFRVWLRAKYELVDKLNAKWHASYKSFDEIDPSLICTMIPTHYPDPWKEWGPAIEDFDTFRSEIHGEFWAKTVAEIKKRHPDIICGLNTYGDYASDTEPIYEGFFDWGVKDYKGRGVNWMARRTGSLPDDLMCLDYFVCWNTSDPEAARANLDFWHKRGKDVVIFAREHSKFIWGGNAEIATHSELSIGKKGYMIFPHATSLFTMLKATYEDGGIPGLLNDPYIGAQFDETQRREIELFNKEVAEVSRKP